MTINDAGYASGCKALILKDYDYDSNGETVAVVLVKESLDEEEFVRIYEKVRIDQIENEVWEGDYELLKELKRRYEGEIIGLLDYSVLDIT